MKDATGKTIQVGDTIAIAQRQGSSVWQGVYPVIEVSPHRIAFQGKTRKCYTSASSSIVMVTPREPSPAEEPQAVNSCPGCGREGPWPGLG